MKSFIIAFAAAFLIVQPAAALQKGHGGGPKPKPTMPPSSTLAGTARGSQATKAHTSAPKPVKQTTQPRGKTTNASVKGTKTNSKPSTAGSPKSSTSGKTKTTTVSTPTTTATSTGTLTPVQQKIQQNTKLAGKLQSRLPAGTDIMTASQGFRNLGQFVAAVNVSNNLGIPFTQLKTKMVDEGMSLGQSIQSLKPTASARVEADRAERDARVIIAETETSTSKNPKKPSGVSGNSR